MSVTDFLHPDYPALTYRNTGVIWDEQEPYDTDIVYAYWERPNQHVKTLDRLIERLKQDRELWLRAVGPDPA